MNKNRKLYLLLIIIIVVFAVIFVFQVREAGGIIIKPMDQPLVSDYLVDIPTESIDQVFGNPGAPNTIVIFADLGDAKSHEVYETIHKLVLQNPMNARLVWKNFPITHWLIFSNILAHQATYCAGEQNKFWDFIELAMQNGNNLDAPGLKTIASNLKLNTDTWWTCTNSDATKQKIQDSINLSRNLGVSDAPTIFVNNRVINLTSDIKLENMLTQLIAP